MSPRRAHAGGQSGQRALTQRHAAKIVIRNTLGLHARPAMAFADLANGYVAKVTLRRGEDTVDGKSIMELMLLAATKGTELEVVCEGDDAETCLHELRKLVDRGFDED